MRASEVSAASTRGIVAAIPTEWPLATAASISLLHETLMPGSLGNDNTAIPPT